MSGVVAPMRRFASHEKQGTYVGIGKTEAVSLPFPNGNGKQPDMLT
jgi:hypothetical protein